MEVVVAIVVPRGRVSVHVNSSAAHEPHPETRPSGDPAPFSSEPQTSGSAHFFHLFAQLLPPQSAILAKKIIVYLCTRNL